MVELITDRTQAHVNRLKSLAKKGWDNMTASERSEWLGEVGDTWKGAYNCSDLNRVEAAVQELSDMFQLELTTKTDWNVWDVPDSLDMSRYLGNVQTLRGYYQGTADVPTAPTSMHGFSYVEANNIEKILTAVHANARAAILGKMVLGRATLGSKE